MSDTARGFQLKSGTKIAWVHAFSWLRVDRDLGKLGRCRRRNTGVRGKFEGFNHVFAEGMA
jgi:hypothetical protein